MNYRRITAAAVTAWVVSIPVGAFIHHGILGRLYAANAAAFRSDPEILRRLPIAFAAELVGFIIAASIYARLYAGGRGVIEGVRFGALVGLMLVSLVVVGQYVTLPISAALGVAQAFECLIAATVSGAIIGAVYGSPVARTTASTSLNRH
jgi:hypothetical protein